MVGPTVPDLRGLFLRGYGSQAYAQNNGSAVGVTSTLHESGALGQVQGDALRAIRGEASRLKLQGTIGGAIYGSSSPGYDHINNVSGSGFKFDSSRVTPTANENRPINTAVRYLIRALP